MMVGKIDLCVQNIKQDPHFTTYTHKKMQIGEESKPNIYTMKLLQENMRENLQNIGICKLFGKGPRNRGKEAK